MPSNLVRALVTWAPHDIAGLTTYAAGQGSLAAPAGATPSCETAYREQSLRSLQAAQDTEIYLKASGFSFLFLTCSVVQH